MVFGGSQDAFFVDDAAGVGQLVQTGLRLWQGEWFLDTTAGMPWMSDVLGKNGSSTYDAVIRAQILDTIGVAAIQSYSSSLDRNTRKLTVNVTVATIYDASVSVAVTL